MLLFLLGWEKIHPSTPDILYELIEKTEKASGKAIDSRKAITSNTLGTKLHACPVTPEQVNFNGGLYTHTPFAQTQIPFRAQC